MHVGIDVREFPKLFITNVKRNNESSLNIKSAIARITNLMQHELKTYVGWILQPMESKYQVFCGVVKKNYLARSLKLLEY